MRTIPNSLRAAMLVLAGCFALPAAHASIIVFGTTLSGANEIPANASPGVGSATITYDNVANTLRVQIVFSGLQGLTTASHIHCCVDPGSNVGIGTELPSFTGFPLGVTAGNYDHVFDTTLAATYSAAFITANGGTPASALAALLAGMTNGRAYLNVHTGANVNVNGFPGGEIRGILSVPEPASLALLGLALVGLGFTRHRGKRCAF